MLNEQMSVPIVNGFASQGTVNRSISTDHGDNLSRHLI
jgi:hypothetical protein